MENPEIIVPVKTAMADFRQKLANLQRAPQSWAYDALCLFCVVVAVWLIFMGWIY